MNIKELKEVIKDLPDDMPVLVELSTDQKNAYGAFVCYWEKDGTYYDEEVDVDDPTIQRAEEPVLKISAH